MNKFKKASILMPFVSGIFLSGYMMNVKAENDMIGHIDEIKYQKDNTIKVSGWAFNNNSTDENVTIKVKVGDDTVYTEVTSKESSDVNQTYGITGNHRFSFLFENKYTGNVVFDIYANEVKIESKKMYIDINNSTCKGCVDILEINNNQLI